MKKIITLLAFLICYTGFSQDPNFLQITYVKPTPGENYVQIINSEIETVMSVIQDIQVLLPKLNATADAVSSLQSQFGEAFKTLSDLSLFFNNFLELFSQLQGNS